MLFNQTMKPLPLINFFVCKSLKILINCHFFKGLQKSDEIQRANNEFFFFLISLKAFKKSPTRLIRRVVNI